MRSSWRRSTVIATMVALVVLVRLSGLALAEISSLEIVDPNGTPIYAKPEDTIHATVSVGADEGDYIWIRGVVGTGSMPPYIEHGPAVQGINTYSVNALVSPDEDEGWTNVSVDAYVDGGPTWSRTNENSVCVDKTPPTAPNAFIGPTTPANNATPTWSWSESSDSASGLGHYEVQIASSVDNTTWGGWVDAYPGTTTETSWTSAGLAAPGFYKIQVRAVDKAGNASAYAASWVCQFDNAPPTDPAPSTLVTKSPGTDWMPTWSWTASIDDFPGKLWQSGLPSEPYEVMLWYNATPYPVVGWTVGGTSIRSRNPLLDGHWTLRVRAHDRAGNVSAWVAASEVYILDTTPPPNVGEVTGPTSPGNVKQPTWLWAAVNDGTWGSGVQHYKVQISVGSGTFVDANPATVTGTSWASNADLADGKYKIRVKAVDNVNLESAGWTESSEYWLDTVPPGNAGMIYVPGTPSTVKMPAWHWIRADDLGGTPIDHYSVEISSNNGGSWASADPPSVFAVEGWQPVWIPYNDLSDGKYLIRVMAFDQAGSNSAWSTASYEYHLDSTPPAAPSNFSVIPASPSVANSPNWTWAACADVAGGVGLHSTAPYEVEISADGGGNWAAANPAAVNAASWMPSGGLIADGGYTIRVRSVDGLGNKSAWGVSGEYVYDTTRPTLPSDITVTPATPSNQLPTWSWTPSTDIGGSGLKLYEVHYSKDNFANYSIVYSYDPPNPPDPSWTATALADGEWRIRVQAIDNANNMSGYVYAPTEYLLDTTGPGVPHTFVDPTPTPCNDTTPTWTWTAPVDAGVGLHETTPYEVQISLNGGDWTDANPATVALASWTANPTLAADGKYKIRARAIDKLGNKSAYAESGEYWLDTTKPVVDDTTWSEPEDKWFSTGNLTFTVDAYDPNVTSIPPTGSGLDKSSAGLLAQIVSYLDEPGFGPWFTAGWVMGTDTIQFNVGGAEAGTHFLQVHVRDLAGNISDRASLKFNVDLQAPTKPAISYAPYTYDTTHEIAWTESVDTGSGVVGYEVQIGTASGGDEKIAWTSVGNVLALDDDAWSTLGVELEPDGVYYFQLRAVDAVGWTSAVSEVQITVDTVSPVLASGLPTGYGNATSTISAEFTDERSGLSPLRTVLMLTYKGVPKQIDPTKLVGDPAYTAGDLTAKITYTPSAPLSLNGENDGEYTVDMTAYDLAGNESNTLEWKFKVDTTPPTPPGEPYAGNIHDDGTWYVNTLRPTFKWEASGDPNAPDGTTGSGLKEYWFQFGAQSSKPMSNTDDIWAAALVDKKSMDPVMPTPGAQTQQWTPPADLPLAVGVEYAARVKALDNVGNASVWVDPPIIYDPHPPTEVTDLAGDLNSENTRPTFTWAAATDGISGVDGYMVKIRREASSNWDILNMFVDFPDGAAGTLAWQIGFELDLGGYVISVAAQDVAGNKGPAVGLDFVVEDITGPVAPVVSRLTPSPTDQTEQQWTWTTPFDAVRYDFGKSIDGIADPTTWDNVGNTNIHVTNFTEDGTHYVKVRAYDIHNNAGPWSVAASVEIDRTPPGIPTSLAVSTPTSDNTPTWTWTASTGDVASYEVVLDGAAAMNIGNVTEYTPAPIIDGTHSLKVQALDSLGNESGWTDEAIVLVDTTPPERPNAPQTTSPTNNRNPLWTWGVVLGAAKYRVLEDDVDKGFVTEPKYTSDNLAEGTHYLRVTALDALGNESAKSEVGYVVIDLTAPAAPEMWPLKPFTNANTVTLIWADVGDAVKYDVEYAIAGIGTVVNHIAVQTLTVDISSAVDGDVVTAKVRGYDAVGNASPWSSSVVSTTVDRTAPTVNFILTPPSRTSNPRPGWEWQGQDDISGVDHYMVAMDMELAFETMENVYIPASNLPDGIHTLSVKAVDSAGNVGTLWTWSEVEIDTTLPEVPVMNVTPLFTNETLLTFEWSASVDAATYELNYSKNGGVTWDDVPNPTAQSYTVDIADVSDGVAVLGKIRAYDGVGNVSDWSDAVQTIIDRTGPIVTIVTPTEPTTTNKSAFTWKWSAADAGSGVAGYWVSLDGGAALWTTESSVKLTGLSPGTHALTVKAVDRLGNIGIAAQSPVVTVVKAYVYDVKPFEGAYKINEISTISFKVGGLYDGQVKVFVGTTELEAWRIVTISSMPAESKFYVLLDEEVMNPGMMTVGIDVGDGLEAFTYEVLTERSGYGFGRLRPW